MQECPIYLAGIRSAIHQRDPVKLHRAAHSFKGAIWNFGELPPVATAQTLETMGCENQMNGAEASYQQLLQELARLQPALKVLVNADS